MYLFILFIYLFFLNILIENNQKDFQPQTLVDKLLNNKNLKS